MYIDSSFLCQLLSPPAPSTAPSQDPWQKTLLKASYWTPFSIPPFIVSLKSTPVRHSLLLLLQVTSKSVNQADNPQIFYLTWSFRRIWHILIYFSGKSLPQWLPGNPSAASYLLCHSTSVSFTDNTLPIASPQGYVGLTLAFTSNCPVLLWVWFSLTKAIDSSISTWLQHSPDTSFEKEAHFFKTIGAKHDINLELLKLTVPPYGCSMLENSAG